ncbi:MAG: PAS domain S-box protein [Chloroflexi bacterium]|nr:PAS domain S-box protein [Chloroflexota bacterium]
MIAATKKSTQPIKILLIEDNPGDIRLIREMLAGVPDASWELQSVGQLSTGLECVAKQQPNVILLDLGLPDSQGLDTLHKTFTRIKGIPIVVLTGLDDEGVGIEAVRHGAQDYLVKRLLSGLALWRAISYAIERKQMEDELREAKEFAESLITSARDGVSVLDSNGVHINVNYAMCEMTGFPKDELVGVGPPHPYWPPEKHEEIDRAFQNTLAGDFADVELTFMRKNGQRFPVIVSPSWVKDKEGNVIGYFAIVKDITERKLAEATLQESEERYRILVENANEAIIVAQDGILKFANPKTAELSGYSIKELASVPFADIIHPDDRDMVVDRYLRRLQGEVFPQIYPFRIIDKEGNTKWAEINAVSIIWEGKPATLNFLTDITERKKAEQQALVNAKLASVGELVAGVAHEVNNPLTGIIGYAQLLADRQDVPQNIKEDLQKIYEESQRTVRIVQNLLRFARQYKPEKSLVDINELIERTLELEAYKLRTSNIGLSAKLAADIPLILADYNQLQQVILNIIANAQQAIAETKRRGKITVTTDVVEDCVSISITDNGPGISPESIIKIFDPFFTTKPEGSGSGLGLSVCHGIITEHGGNIYAESTPGKGTTFIIELPIATGEQAVIREEKPAKKKSRRPRRKMTGKILIAEDESSIRAVLTRNLSASGYQVQAVSNGKDALDKLANNVYDLLLFDLKMPGMSGRELYEAIKKKHPNSVKRVVFITGDVMTADTHDFLASTGRPYLIKPFDSKDITGILEKVLAEQNR